MQLDWNAGELAAGLACYRRGEFFLAHEHWENIWRQSQGEEKIFLQGMIQLAGALHHYRRHNLRGTTALLRASLSRLQRSPERLGGLLVAQLCGELAEWLARLESGAPVNALPYPRIRLE